MTGNTYSVPYIIIVAAILFMKVSEVIELQLMLLLLPVAASEVIGIAILRSP